MKDLIQCTIARNDFQRWLELGHAPLTVWQGETTATTLIRLEKRPSIDYLYQTPMERDNSISWNDGLTFCGVYDIKSQALYLADGSMSCLTTGQAPLAINTGTSMVKEICGKINQRVESTIANDRNNLPTQELTDYQALRDFQHYQEYGSKKETIRRVFHDNPPDGQFHSSYTLDNLPEATFLAYIQDKDGFIRAEAEHYIETNQENILLQFLKNEILMVDYQALMQDTGSPIHRMKEITDAIKTSGAKTVTVTIQKDGIELTFKAMANCLTGHRNYYNASNIPAQDRREFERLFGRYADYKAEDIIRITYGRNTIYEAPSTQIEEKQGPVMQMGGM